MGFLDNIKKAISTELSGFVNNVETTEPPKAIFPDWLYSTRLGQPRNINIPELRLLAKSSWIQMVENTLRKEVMTVPHDLVNKDPKDETNYDVEESLVDDFLKLVNDNGQSIVDLCIDSISDVAEIDSGVWNFVYYLDSYELKDVPILDGYGNETTETETKMVLKPLGKRRLAEVYAVNGGSFLKNIDVYKRIRGYYQYSYRFPTYKPMSFEPEEIAWISMNNRADSAYGFSPLQSVQQVIELLINSIRWNKDFFKSNMIPPAIVGLPGANPDSMKKFKSQWQSRIKGKGHELLFVNTDAKIQQLITNPRDLEFLDGQKWYFHLAFAVYGMSPTEVGFHENVNRSSQEGQERVTVKNAIKPFLTLFENIINNRLIPEILQDPSPKIKFVFKPKDHVAEQIEHTQDMDKIDRNLLTINEYRKNVGLDEVEWGSEPLFKQMADLTNDPNNSSNSSDDSKNSDDSNDSNKYYQLLFEKHLKNGNR